MWFAGASAMAGSLHLIPRYLPRFGMAPVWVAYTRPLVLVLLTIDLLVTLVFKAGVEAQSGAYATGVLVLMLSAAVAAALALRREGRWRLSCYCWLVSAVFTYTLVANVFERPDGIVVAGIFITAVIAFSAASRYRRATELRVANLKLLDEQSAGLWQSMVSKKVNLVPIRSTDLQTRQRKAAEIQRHYAVQGPLAFVHVQLLDNRSEFLANLRVRVTAESGNYLIEISHAIAIANTIACISELARPDRHLPGPVRAEPDDAIAAVPVSGRRRDGDDGLHDPSPLLELDSARGCEAGHLPHQRVRGIRSGAVPDARPNRATAGRVSRIPREDLWPRAPAGPAPSSM